MTEMFPRITFHRNSIMEESFVERTFEYEGRLFAVTAETPFHPRDYQWPDQPADRGVVINAVGERFCVRDAVFVAIAAEGRIFTDKDIPVKKGETGWLFCVGHVLDDGCGFAQGDKITLEVEGGYRKALSRVHSAAHVMSLALNRALAGFWSKDAPLLDDLGQPCFDSLAMVQSVIEPALCVDRYRMGKSLRKKGFSAKELGAHLKECEDTINRLLSEWLSSDSPITIVAADDALASRRLWRTKISGLTVEIPCGGTHVGSLSEIGAINAAMEMPDEEALIVKTVTA